ncbi:MAG: cell wall metabolism sensor histidine kinase WalK [Phycisphaerae bacterium]|nr:cell wall metabolism sensor histidine kinase WalK [Phycisphaerae bacterium]
MKRHKFFWKLLAGNILLMGIILAVGGFFSYRYLNANYQRENLENQCRMARMSQLHFQRIWLRPAGEIDAACKQLFADSPMRMTVIAADGRVLGDSQADPLTMENHKTDDRPEILNALRGDSGKDTRASETLGMEFRYFAEPITKYGKVVGVVRVAMPIRAIAEGRAVIRNALLWAALAAIAVTVVIAGMLSWMWHRPLGQITQTARNIAAGDLTAKAHVRGSDELAQLAAALNEMRQSLATQIDTITSQQAHLSAVVRNLREGVIALDDGGNVVLINQAAAELLAADAESAVGRHLQEVARIPDVLDAFSRAAESHKPVSRQIEVATNHGRRIVDLHAEKVAADSSDDIAVLLVLRDITETARITAMKTEFVANASHELRTPLATIRAAVDSLTSVGADDSEEVGKILPILDRHVRRLEDMTHDLLDLHVIETARQQLSVEKIELASLADWVKDHFAQAAGDKNVELTSNTTQPATAFESDQTLIKLILQNLIDNAIKFTPASGRVQCLIQPEDDRLRIQVSDTGCGIPPDMQEKVFERFFQAEPSRTGDTKVRGTGLGLAIVKHATDRLGGNIMLESTPGEGTTVTIRIPAAQN